MGGREGEREGGEREGGRVGGWEGGREGGRESEERAVKGHQAAIIMPITYIVSVPIDNSCQALLCVCDFLHASTPVVS